MTRTPTAAIKPELLVWARKSIGLSVSDAARKIRESAERIEAWEAGDAAPTIAQLRKAANAYKRPLGVFYLPEPPLDFMPLADFRTLSESDEGLSADLRLEIRRAQEQRELHIELLEILSVDEPVAPRVTLQGLEDPEGAGVRLRHMLGVDLAVQRTWRDTYDSLNGWIAAVEDLDYLVLQTSGVDFKEMRGFSIAEDVFPAIVLNGSDSPNGKVFTLFHELAHIQLSKSGVCDLHGRGNRHQDQVEVFCNQVAAAGLMPKDAFLSSPTVARNRGDDEWTDYELSQLAREFSVSQEAALRRLLTFGRVSAALYRRKRSEFLEIYQQRRSQQPPGRPAVATMRVRDLGRPFVRTVLNAYHERQITTADVSRYLGARLKHLPRIEARVSR